jgi:tetratricopeptide (TPR) repeat protein
MRALLALPLLALVSCKPGMLDYNRGVEKLNAKEYAAARPHFEKAVGANPDFSEAWASLGMSKVWLAKKAAEEKRDDEAVALWRNAAEDLRKAKSLMDQGRFVAVREANEQARMKEKVGEMVQNMDLPLLANDKLLLLAIRMTPWPE